MAAVLLRLPSIIRSEQYAMLNPHAHIGYITHVQRQKDSKEILRRLIAQANAERQPLASEEDDDTTSFIVKDDEDDDQPDKPPDEPVRTKLHDPKAILHQLGYIDSFAFKEGSKTYRYVFPQCSLYSNRGQQLKHLNRMEYRALVKFRAPSQNEKTRKNELQFSKGFTIQGIAVQALYAKQQTPLVIRKPPPHPGKRPDTTSERYHSWLEAANKYAEFFLVLFRPEPDCCENDQVNNYAYTWDALEDFVEELQNDNSIISKFRLMAMHTRMRGFVTSYRSKLILTKYRSRDRDLWTKEQLQEWETRCAWERRETSINEIFEQFAFEAEHSDLGLKKTMELERKLAHTNNLINTFEQTFDSNEASHSPEYQQFPKHNTQQPHKPADTPPDIQDMGTRIRRFDREGPPATAKFRKPYSYHVFPYLQRKHKHRETVAKFKDRQRHLYELYKKYFRNPADPKNSPPPVLMLHGGAGTGKSTLLNAILDYAEFNNIHTIRSAFNSINALHVRGDTTSSLLHLRPEDVDKLNGMDNNQIPHFTTATQNTLLIVVDELSNQAPWHLAKLSKSCQQARGNELPFGGIPVILCGDLMQLEPVKAGLSFPAAIIQMCENKWSKPSTKHAKRMKAKQDKQNKKKTAEQEVPINRFDDHHPFNVGATIIRHALLYELNEQVRTDDPHHMNFVTKLYNCQLPTMEDLQAIPVLSKDDFRAPDSPWFQAPILVLTHRERHSLTHFAAVRFAKAKGRPVIRWKAHTRNWKQAPPEHLKHEAYSDPCFYEYWVDGAEAFLNNTISKSLGLVNAQSFTCHSLTLHTPEQQNDLINRINSSVPGEVITLPQQPLAINAKLNIKNFTNEQLQNMEHFRISFDDGHRPDTQPPPPPQDHDNTSQYTDTDTLPSLPSTSFMSKQFTIPRKQKTTTDNTNDFVIPITAGSGRNSINATVFGNNNIKPSEIDIIPHFPFQLSFVMTVNKSEGQTMPNAILALSERQGAKFNYTFRHLYVAASRVKRRDHNRLLLVGKAHRKWLSVNYLTTLRPPMDSKCVLRGFAARGGPGWDNDTWDPDVTLHQWEHVCDNS